LAMRADTPASSAAPDAEERGCSELGTASELARSARNSAPLPAAQPGISFAGHFAGWGTPLILISHVPNTSAPAPTPAITANNQNHCIEGSS
ncbi:hypothetical protein, partial [Methylobacterium sp. E-046]|uniref:hypothetical protein n=1 Tax=Methylobacterium sp. E-046 TaxID=2836576 RepID=UPI001FB8E788